MERLRVGVIGAGSWTRICHIPCLQADPRAVVTALCGRRKAQAEAQAAEFGIASVYTDYHQLLAAPDVDAVTIATPNVAHYDIAMAAIAAGKHVFCEKPLAMNETQSKAMWSAAERAGVVHQVAFTFRYLHATNLARQIVQSGELGTVYRVDGYAESNSGLRADRQYNWRDTKALAGTGMLGDMGSHVVDLARYITDCEIVSVSGRMRILPCKAGSWSAGVGSANDASLVIDTDDDAEFFARLTNGADGYFHISRIMQGERRAYLQVSGSKGAIRIHYSRGNIDALYQCKPDAAEYRQVPLPNGARPEHNHALYKMLAAYVTACIHRTKPQTVATFADGHQVQAVLDAVVRASESGLPEHVHPEQ